MIIKVQKPLFPPDSKEWLFYNKSQTVSYQIVPPIGIVGMMGDDLKMYCKARLRNGVVTILRRVEDQPW